MSQCYIKVCDWLCQIDSHALRLWVLLMSTSYLAASSHDKHASYSAKEQALAGWSLGYCKSCVLNQLQASLRLSKSWVGYTITNQTVQTIQRTDRALSGLWSVSRNPAWSVSSKTKPKKQRTKYQENCKKRKHSIKLEGALKDYEYIVTTLPIIIGQSGSQYHTTSDALAKIGIEQGPISKVVPKLYETLVYSVLTFHKILAIKRVIEGENRQNKPDPP